MAETGEQLLNRIWAMLQRKQREAMDETQGRGKIPNFRVCITPEEKHILLSYINSLDVEKRAFIGIDGRTIFGCEVKVIVTPYLEKQ